MASETEKENPMIILIFFAYVGACILAGYVASEKQRSGFAWFGLSLLVSPFFAMLALAALPHGNLQPDEDGVHAGYWTMPKPGGTR